MQQRSIRVPLSIDGVDFHIGATVYWPNDGSRAAPVVWFCFPGADFTRRYYDLRLGDDTSRSFAVAMTERGHVVATIDPLGIGDSDTVDERRGYEIDFLIRAHNGAIEALSLGLVDGSLGVPPAMTGGAFRIGIGHSMGGMLVTLQQGTCGGFDGIATLGTSFGGLNTLLNEMELGYADDPAGARAAIATLARNRFGSAFLKIAPGGAPPAAFAGEDEVWTEAVGLTGRAGVVATAATLCMLPGGFVTEAGQVATPVFIGIGDADLPMPTHGAVAAFPASHDVTLLVIPNTGHMHFGFSSAPRLFERLAQWSTVCGQD